MQAPLPRDFGPSETLELWGGLECTVARIGDGWRNQFDDTGHSRRPEDLDRIAALGIRRLRYPVLWETVSPDDPAQADWSWHDGRLTRLRDLSIAPIAGLLHHGSGPRYTDLLDRDLPEKLAIHARRVAERYPWIEAWTPVNEPLTTARFSGLYGHWYPHGHDEGSFLRALVNQCRAVAAAMAAIRQVIPGATLVQTEDMGKTFSTPRLAYQADFENGRRWLSFDLLCGRVDEAHPFWLHLVHNGVEEADLASLRNHPCPPDIIGINHYLTSERYLDQRRRRYPDFSWGGNGRDTYADVEAVRVHLPRADTGPAARLRETWERYRIPIAVTEAHLGATRDEQLRWLKQVWDAARTVRAEGADVRAVTVWSMLGAVDWNSLLTRRAGFYEPGAFDVRTADGTPRPTAIARAAESLCRTGDFDHPVLDGEGWWQRHDRYYRAVAAIAGARRHLRPRTLLVVGQGRLGRSVAAIAGSRGLAVHSIAGERLDIADPRAVDALLDETKPWAVVNCAGFPGALNAERDPDRVLRDNVTAAVVLAEACRMRSLPCAALSSDQVFDGAQHDPYRESHPVHPIGIFGRTKAEAERAILTAHRQALVVRTGPLFGAGRPELVRQGLHEILRVGGVGLDRDLVVSPTFVPDLVHALLDLLIDGATGLWHLANEGRIDARDFLARMRLPPADAIAGGGRTARNLSLGSERATLLPSLASALDRFERLSA